MVPNFTAWIAECWGWGPEVNGANFTGASNVVVGTNPPYYVDNFLAFYPKFGGATRLSVTGTTTQGSNIIAAVPSTGTAAPGQLITTLVPGTIFPGGTIITAVSVSSGHTPGTITVSQPALVAGAQSFTIYVDPFVPIVVLNAYVALASASVVQARWQDTWPIAMGLYIAHFATLYLRSDGNPMCTAGQAAAAGLAVGISINKSAGPVSQGMQLPGGLDDWGTWQSTAYGSQFATFAKSIGSGAMFLW